VHRYGVPSVHRTQCAALTTFYEAAQEITTGAQPAVTSSTSLGLLSLRETCRCGFCASTRIHTILYDTVLATLSTNKMYMQKRIASSATIILLFVVIAIVATVSIQHASALIASSTNTSTSATLTPIVPSTLKLAHRNGTAYIDTFTDGTKTYTFPGDPAIDSRFHEANAPIPTHKGMTWVGSNGFDAYDTASGQLEIGDYAQQANGTYIVHLPAQTFTEATSTSQWPDRYVAMTSDPSVAPTAPFSPAPAPQAATPTSTTDTSPITPATSSTTTTPPPSTSSSTGTSATSTQ